MRAVDLITNILDGHGIKWALAPTKNIKTDLTLIMLKNRHDLILVRNEKLIVSFFPTYLAWQCKDYALKVCLYDSGSSKLVEKYVHMVRGSNKSNKYQK